MCACMFLFMGQMEGTNYSGRYELGVNNDNLYAMDKMTGQTWYRAEHDGELVWKESVKRYQFRNKFGY